MALESPLDTVQRPSGIQKDAQGNRFVGGSVRSDGTTRKVHKVRPGFTPKEDVPKYVPLGRRKLQEIGGLEVRDNPLGSQGRGADVVLGNSSSGSARRQSPHIANINKILQNNSKEAVASERDGAKLKIAHGQTSIVSESSAPRTSSFTKANEGFFVKVDEKFPTFSGKLPVATRNVEDSLIASLARLNIDPKLVLAEESNHKTGPSEANNSNLTALAQTQTKSKPEVEVRSSIPSQSPKPKYVPPWKRNT